MPSYNAPMNLVQVAFDAYNAPIQSTLLKEKAVLGQQQIQSNAVNLQNQMALQSDLKNIWGPGGMSAADAAANNPDDFLSSPKFMATAQALAMHGQPQAAMSMLSAASMTQYRKAEMQKAQQQTQWRNLQEVGAAFGAASDDSSEQAAIAEAQAKGIDITQYGLTGKYAVDAPMLNAISRSSMSRAQQLTAQNREGVLAFREGQADIQNDFKAFALNQADRRLGIQQALLDLRSHAETRLTDEGAKRDARAQEALDIKKLGAEDRSYANASRVTKDDSTIAQGIFATDDRTADLDPNLQKSLAGLAAQRAKISIANSLKDSGQVEWQPEDYQAALANEMDKMAREGLFNMGNNPRYNPPRQPAPPTPQKKEATTMKKMQDDPKVQAILNNASMSDVDKTKAIHSLGY